MSQVGSLYIHEEEEEQCAEDIANAHLEIIEYWDEDHKTEAVESFKQMDKKMMLDFAAYFLGCGDWAQRDSARKVIDKYNQGNK